MGTHEQQFNRLVEYIDKLKSSGAIKEDIIIQTGFSTYEPKACSWSKLYPYQQMLKYVEDARVVITHGDPSSFIMPLQIGKIPIVVPRKKEFEEHVNDHQVNFCRIVAERQGNILVVEDVEKLEAVIAEYDELVSAMPAEMRSNNTMFCEKVYKITAEIFGGYRLIYIPLCQISLQRRAA